MVKKLLLFVSLVTALSLAGGTVTVLAAPASAGNPVVASLFDGSKDAACGGAQSNDNPVSCDPNSSSLSINKIITFALNALSIVVGLAAVLMIIIGGLKFITSQGEAANTAAARNTILYAIVGLVVVALAQFIVRFVVNRTNPKPQNAPTANQTIQGTGGNNIGAQKAP